MNNDEKIYMQLRNLQQQVSEQVEVHYECLFKLANYLQVKVIDVFLATILRVGLQPYFRLATTCMTGNTLIEHKEAAIICEESRLVITNYNILIIQLESKPVAQPIVNYTIFKQ